MKAVGFMIAFLKKLYIMHVYVWAKFRRLAAAKMWVYFL